MAIFVYLLADLNYYISVYFLGKPDKSSTDRWSSAADCMQCEIVEQPTVRSGHLEPALDICE